MCDARHTAMGLLLFPHLLPPVGRSQGMMHPANPVEGIMNTWLRLGTLAGCGLLLLANAGCGKRVVEKQLYEVGLDKFAIDKTGRAVAAHRPQPRDSPLRRSRTRAAGIRSPRVERQPTVPDRGIVAFESQASSRTGPAQMFVAGRLCGCVSLKYLRIRVCGELADGAISWVCPLPYLKEVAVPAIAEGAQSTAPAP